MIPESLESGWQQTLEPLWTYSGHPAVAKAARAMFLTPDRRGCLGLAASRASTRFRSGDQLEFRRSFACPAYRRGGDRHARRTDEAWNRRAEGYPPVPPPPFGVFPTKVRKLSTGPIGIHRRSSKNQRTKPDAATACLLLRSERWSRRSRMAGGLRRGGPSRVPGHEPIDHAHRQDAASRVESGRRGAGGAATLTRPSATLSRGAREDQEGSRPGVRVVLPHHRLIEGAGEARGGRPRGRR